MTFKPGQSGNPGGEVKGKQRLAREELLPHLDKATAALVAALADPKTAVPAAKEIYNRLFGQAPQAIELSGKDGGPLVAVIRDKIDSPKEP